MLLRVCDRLSDLTEHPVFRQKPVIIKIRAPRIAQDHGIAKACPHIRRAIVEIRNALVDIRCPFILFHLCQRRFDLRRIFCLQGFNVRNAVRYRRLVFGLSHTCRMPAADQDHNGPRGGPQTGRCPAKTMLHL